MLKNCFWTKKNHEAKLIMFKKYKGKYKISNVCVYLFDPGLSKPGTKNPRPGDGELLWLRVLRLFLFWIFATTVVAVLFAPEVLATTEGYFSAIFNSAQRFSEYQ